MEDGRVCLVCKLTSNNLSPVSTLEEKDTILSNRIVHPIATSIKAHIEWNKTLVACEVTVAKRVSIVQAASYLMLELQP